MIKSILHVHGQKQPLHKTKIVISSLYLVGLKALFWYLVGIQCELSQNLWGYWAKNKQQYVMWCLRIGTIQVKNIASHAHKTGSLYLVGFFFKFSNRQPCPFYIDSWHLPQSFCTHNLHTDRFPGHCTPEHQLHCPWRKKKHKSVSMEQSWRGDFQCRFLISKIEENPRLGSSDFEVWCNLYCGKKAFIHWGHVETTNFSRAKWAKTKVSVHLH